MYDATPFLKEHPGGADSVLLVAGTDATEEFDAIHSSKAKEQLLQYCIGNLMTAVPGMSFWNSFTGLGAKVYERN